MITKLEDIKKLYEFYNGNLTAIAKQLNLSREAVRLRCKQIGQLRKLLEI